ncbi:MAG: hypothetical protein HUJ79_06285 [Firmicutes bacterium]|nr:hypothetical protein [Bacillota bacterium]
MKGNTIGEFIDDILMTGGPEKEFVFQDRYYFLETVLEQEGEEYILTIDEYNNSNPEKKKLICTHTYKGRTLQECVETLEKDCIFDNMNIYQAEREIEVLFG